MDETRAAKESPSLGKELKIGLSVIVVLLGVFGYVVYLKFFKQTVKATPVADKNAAAKDKQKEGAAKPRLASGPASPTVVAPGAGSSTPPANSAATASSRTTTWQRTPSASGSRAPTSGGTTSGSGASADRYGSRYGSPSGGPPAYQLGPEPVAAGESSDRHTNMSANPYAYTSSPTAAPGERYALDEPTSTSAAPSSSAGVRFAPEAQNDPYRQTSGASPGYSRGTAYDPYGRTSTSGRRTSPGPAVQTAADSTQSSGAGSNPYSSARSYEIYGRDASGAPVAEQRGASATHATTVSTSTPHARRPPPPLDRTSDEYVVQPNDSYWTISERLYGVGAYFRALYEHNSEQFPRADQLRPGAVISCPSLDALRQTYPDLCPSEEHAAAAAAPTTLASTGNAHLAAGGRVYVVEEGDTLFDIARFELGRAARWAEIYDLNRQQIGQNIDYLRPGTELLLPPEEDSDTSFTRRPRPTTRQR